MVCSFDGDLSENDTKFAIKMSYVLNDHSVIATFNHSPFLHGDILITR